MCSSFSPCPEFFSSLSYGVSAYQYQQCFNFPKPISSNCKIVDDEVLSSKVRVLQDNLVFVSGLPAELANLEILGSSLYFGRYGIVQKIILNQSSQSRKNVSYQAYVTYSNCIDASLAIVALDGFTLKGKALKVSYGTTKYCAYFLKGFQCPNPECFYLHKKDPKKQLRNTDSKEVFKKQIAVAVDTVQTNFIEIVAKTLMNDFEYVLKGWPTINEVIDYLERKKIIAKNTIDFAFKFVRGQICHNQTTDSFDCQASVGPSTCLGDQCFSEGKQDNQNIKIHKSSFSFLENKSQSLLQSKLQINTKLAKSHSSSTLNSPLSKNANKAIDVQCMEIFKMIQESTKKQKQIQRKLPLKQRSDLDIKIQSMICKQLSISRLSSRLGFLNSCSQSSHIKKISEIILNSIK